MVVQYNRIQYIENGGPFVTSTYIIIGVVEIMHSIPTTGYTTYMAIYNINYKL